MGQISFTVNLVLAALFVFALMGFMINIANDNDAPINIGNDNEVSNLYNQTQSGLSQFRNDSESTTTSIIETTIAPGSQTAQSSAPFAITILNVIGNLKNTLLLANDKIFGNNPNFAVFIMTFVGIIGFIMFLYVWQTLRGGIVD